jgi:hypothetical protein
MIKLGRVKAALQYINTHSDKFKPDQDFYLKLLQKCPELEFASALIEVIMNIHKSLQSIY